MYHPQSFNRYSYVGNDPVNNIDPSGLLAFGSGPPGLPPLITLPPESVDVFSGGGGGFFFGWGGFGGGGGRPMPVRPVPDEPGGGGGGGQVGNGPVDLKQLGDPPKTCDEKLAALFGGPGAIVGSTYDPNTLGQYAGFNRPNGVPRARGHGPVPEMPDPTNPADAGGIIHIYGNSTGTATDTGLYAPSGGTVGRMQTTGLRNTQIRVSYPGGRSITFVHVTAASGPPNAMGSVRIGNIGGPGGNTPGYIHSHLVFFKNGARVDPRKVFCGQ